MIKKRTTPTIESDPFVRLVPFFWNSIAGQRGVNSALPAILVGRQSIGYQLIDLRASTSVTKRVDMNEYLFPADTRRNKAKALLVIPSCDSSFSSHIFHRFRVTGK
jgi:hypothetical protein